MESHRVKERENIISKLRDFFVKKAALYHLEMVFLYGSWASGFPQPDSDIDLALVFSSEVVSDEEKFLLITDISYNISKELKRDVNIICIYEDFRHPMLYYNAIVLGIPIFITNDEKFYHLKMQAISQMEDFSIFGIPWQLEIARKNLKGGR